MIKTMDIDMSNGFPIDMVEADEFLSLVLKCVASKEFEEYVRDRSDDFKAGAMWGASFASIYANTHATHYGARLVEEKLPSMEDDILLYYPCNYCGSCSLWLAAYEPGSGLDTHEQLIEACKRRGCNLVNTAVPKEDLYG